MEHRHLAVALVLPIVLASCQAAPSGPVPPAPSDTAAAAGPDVIDAEDDTGGEAETFDGITASETVRFTGTEPFWGGQVAGSTLTYSTPENQEGSEITVNRFAGRGGVSWNGAHQGARFVLAVTPGECSDGMSDRTYPFVATLEVAGEQRSGCAWTERRSFTGSPNP